ncbi:MAG: SAM-dependent methyltransferase [Myxococcota bacterium]|jgi:SAM-dependent methyltransferase
MFQSGGPSLVELVQQGLSSTVHGYDLLAPKFEHTPFRTPDDVLDRVVEVLRRDAPFGDVIDLCCGTGAATAAVRPLCERVTGIDFSEGMLGEARARLGPDPDVRFVHGDVFEADLGGPYDLAVCFGALGHVERHRQPAFLAAVRRSLRPGGRFVFVTHTVPPWTSPTRWAAEGFNAVMRARNAVIRPEFIMYYLIFCVPEVLPTLESAGFQATVTPLGLPRAKRFVIVDALAV